jgi:hypothetical protein
MKSKCSSRAARLNLFRPSAVRGQVTTWYISDWSPPYDLLSKVYTGSKLVPDLHFVPKRDRLNSSKHILYDIGPNTLPGVDSLLSNLVQSVLSTSIPETKINSGQYTRNTTSYSIGPLDKHVKIHTRRI